MESLLLSQVTVGQRIAELRREAGRRAGGRLTQAELARRLNVSRQTVVYWENDVQAPRGENLMQLAAELGSTPQYILHGTDEESAEDAVANVGLEEARAYEMLYASIRVGMGKEDGSVDYAVLRDQVRAAIKAAKSWGWNPAPLYELLGRLEAGDVE